jgi:hypothetical protein
MAASTSRLRTRSKLRRWKREAPSRLYYRGRFLAGRVFLYVAAVRSAGVGAVDSTTPASEIGSSKKAAFHALPGFRLNEVNDERFFNV